MSVADAAEFAFGLAVVMTALRDVFGAILVPGPARGAPDISARIRRVFLPLWRRVSGSPDRAPGDRLSNAFAPFLVLAVFGSWLALLLFGFGLMFHAAAGSFSPPLEGFRQAIYVAGSSLVTLGVSEVNAQGIARWLILAAGVTGFAVITASVTFVIQIQTSLRHRETPVLSITGAAGRPPSGLALLETYAALGLRGDLPRFFDEWRRWSADTMHSHMMSPVLIYVHSVDAESDWLATFEAVLDAAALVAALTADEAQGAATLMHRTGARTAAHLCDLLGIEGLDVPAESGAVDDAADRLRRAGYALNPDSPRAAVALGKLRSDHRARIGSLARHLGAERAA